jgi:hypothetical protein
MMMNFIHKIKPLPACLILFLAFTSGCYYDQVYIPEPEGEISFSADIQPFFDSNCASCHPDDSPPDLQSGNAYNSLIAGGYINTADPASSIIYIKIAPGGSMETHSTTTGTAMVLKWIEQGAKNN